MAIELTHQEKIGILDDEIRMLEEQSIMGAAKKIEGLKRSIARETFRQEAFKKAGITRPSSFEKLRQNLKQAESDLEKAEREVKALAEVRAALIRPHELESGADTNPP